MSDTIVCDFVFVPNGAPFPTDWVRRHPDYITLPARFTGSPAFMERLFGKRRPAGRYVFDKTVRVPLQLGQTESDGTKKPPAQAQSWLGFEASAEPIQAMDGASVPIAVPVRGTDHKVETHKRDIWTGLTKEELLGPGLAYLERRAAGDGMIDFIAGLDFKVGDAQLRTTEAKSPSIDPDPVRIAAIGDLKCEGFPGGCTTGGSRGTTGMYGVNQRTLCTSCAIKILGIGNQTGREQADTLMRYILPGR